MSIPMLGFKDIVGKTFESVELFVIEVLKVERNRGRGGDNDDVSRAA